MDAIFIDMDDVIVDLSETVAKMRDIDLDSTFGFNFDFIDIFGVDANEFFNSVDHNWWADLNPTPWMRSVINIAKSLATGDMDKIFILTALPVGCNSESNAACVRGKMEWLDRHFKVSQKNILFAYRKSLLAKPGHVIIDDRDKNVENFDQKILIPSRWNNKKDSFYYFQKNHSKWIKKEALNLLGGH